MTEREEFERWINKTVAENNVTARAYAWAGWVARATRAAPPAPVGGVGPVAYVGYGGEGKPKTLLLKSDLPVGTTLYAKPVAQRADADEDPPECSECHGKGSIDVTHEPLRDGYTETFGRCCDSCQGTGNVAAQSAPLKEGGSEPVKAAAELALRALNEVTSVFNVTLVDDARRRLKALIAAPQPAAINEGGKGEGVASDPDTKADSIRDDLERDANLWRALCYAIQVRGGSVSFNDLTPPGWWKVVPCWEVTVGKATVKRKTLMSALEAAIHLEYEGQVPESINLSAANPAVKLVQAAAPQPSTEALTGEKIRTIAGKVIDSLSLTVSPTDWESIAHALLAASPRNGKLPRGFGAEQPKALTDERINELAADAGITISGKSDYLALMRFACALLAAEQPEGEIVLTKTQAGELVAVTRQDEEGRILLVLWEKLGPAEHLGKDKHDAALKLLKRVSYYHHYNGSRILPLALINEIDAAIAKEENSG